MFQVLLRLALKADGAVLQLPFEEEDADVFDDLF